jgi:hypothetical protein
MNAYKTPAEPCVCGIMHGADSAGPADAHGCVLAKGHAGPHEFADSRGGRWLWETDMECNCAHCRRCEGDYCTVFWRKPIAPS